VISSKKLTDVPIMDYEILNVTTILLEGHHDLTRQRNLHIFGNKCIFEIVIYDCFILFLQLNNDLVNIINISMGSIIAVLMQQALQNWHT
jgi:hypothetical protein